ncbi:MAG: hypothetical protein JWM18_1181, partial [Chloroflexi bacterium]|nr:hypothetical protein [Chloroflexota bacterium]
GAPDAVAYPPPRPDSRPTRASRACREGSAGRGTTSNAARCSHRPPERLPGWALEPRMGITAFPVAPRCAALSAEPEIFQEQRSRCSRGASAGWLRKLRARSARRRRVPARGGGSRHRARQRTMSCDQTGGTQSPPSKNRRQSGPTRISTGGRTAGHLHRRQNCRASPPAAEHPGIPTGGGTAGHPHRRQNSRASPPEAEHPGIPTGGGTPGHPHRPRNTRASPPAAELPRTAQRPVWTGSSPWLTVMPTAVTSSIPR